MSGDRTARDVVVHGEVQGVFFRDSCQSEAEEAGVAGWVSNASDGTVAVRLEGSASAVDRLLGWLEHGPSKAGVDHLEVTEVEPAALSGFEVR